LCEIANKVIFHLSQCSVTISPDPTCAKLIQSVLNWSNVC